MKSTVILFFLASVAMSAVFAADAGHHQAVLIKALSVSAKGECPPALFGAKLLQACKEQMPALGKALLANGKIKSAVYQGTKEMPNGVAEVYVVHFEKKNVTWMIAVGPDSKVESLFSENL